MTCTLFLSFYTILGLLWKSEVEAREKWGNNLKMKIYSDVSKRLALPVGDILTDLAEQRQYENNHASGTALQSNLF